MASSEPWRAEASRALLGLGAQVRAGGRELLDSASVLSVTANDRDCRASVQDGVETYQLEGPLRSIECSCYDGGDCEHVAAALMHLLVSGPLDGGGGGEPESKPSGPMLVPRAAAEPMGLPLDMRSAMAQFAFETWLKRFRKAEVGPQGRLVFLLSFSEVGLCV